MTQFGGIAGMGPPGSSSWCSLGGGFIRAPDRCVERHWQPHHVADQPRVGALLTKSFDHGRSLVHRAW